MPRPIRILVPLGQHRGVLRHLARQVSGSPPLRRMWVTRCLRRQLSHLAFVLSMQRASLSLPLPPVQQACLLVFPRPYRRRPPQLQPLSLLHIALLWYLLVHRFRRPAPQVYNGSQVAWMNRRALLCRSHLRQSMSSRRVSLHRPQMSYPPPR